MASTSDSPFASDAMLKARIEDAVRLSTMRSAPVFIGFLDERQQVTAKGMLRSLRGICALFWGGHAEGERTLLGVFPDHFEPDETWFPLTSIALHYRKGAAISHRDVLGALLSTGIRRDLIGDILCADGLSVVFVKDEIATFLSEQITKIGGEGVTVESPFSGELPVAHTFRELRDTVASPRMDAVLRICLSTSREEAARRITAGLISLNHVPCLSVAAEIREGDILSVRGAGRFRVEQVGPLTKKGRFFITVNQYL